MDDAVKTVVKFSMDEFTCEGLENLNKEETYMYVANHRDIVCRFIASRLGDQRYEYISDYLRR